MRSFFICAALCVSASAWADKPKPQYKAEAAQHTTAAHPSTQAQALTSDAVAQLQQQLSRYNALAGRFEQTLISKAGKTLQTTTGDFQLMRPGLYRWVSDEPFPQEVVGNGYKIWVYDPDLEQVTITPQARMPFNPAVLLSGNLDGIAENYRVKRQESEQGDSYLLDPLTTSQSSFAQLTLAFADDALDFVEFTDQLGQQTRIQFLSVKTNPTLTTQDFEFIPAEGVDVLLDS